MDIIPYFNSLHHGYNEHRHKKILTVLRSEGSAKELSLAVLEQLECVPCFNSLAMLLPLLDLSENRTLSMLDQNLYNSVCHSGICEECAEEVPQYVEKKCPETAILTCLQNVNLSDNTTWMLPHFQKMVLYLVNENRCLFDQFPETRTLLLKIFPNFSLTFCDLIQHKIPSSEFDPVSCIMCAVFQPLNTSFLFPQVYNIPWLFSKMLPWVNMILKENLDSGEENILNLALSPLLFFSKQTFTIPTKQTSDIKLVFDTLINIAVNNTDLKTRRSATSCLQALCSKQRTSDKLRTIESFVSHSNSSVSGLFLDTYRGILSHPGTDLTHHKILKIADLAVTLDKCDVLLESDRIVAVLSILQLIGLRKLPLLEDRVSGYLSEVAEMVKVKQTEVACQINELHNSNNTTDLVPAASIRVQGETISEPSNSEKLASLNLARCRLDLILYNLARCRECFGL